MKRIICIALLLLLTAGCAKQAEPAPEPVPAPTEASAKASAAPAEAAGYAFTFTAKTLDGKRVTEEYFGQYDLTMVNVWASWCGPCQGELGELGVLYGQLPENVGFLSITVDDAQDLREAQALLEKNGCTFPCLDGQSSSGLYRGFLDKVTAIPTTLFFDRQGNQVGTWIVGVPRGDGSVSAAYLQQIETRLAGLNGK